MNNNNRDEVIHLNADEITSLGNALADGWNVNICMLTIPDAIKVFAIAYSIIKDRKEKNARQASLKRGSKRLSAEHGLMLIQHIGIKPSQIMLELLEDPIMQALLFAISTAISWKPPVMATAPTGGGKL